MNAERKTIPGGRRFRCLDLFEQLVENPDEIVVVFTPKHLCDKCSSFDEELYSKLQTHENELRLRISVLYPGGPDVWCTVVEYYIRLPVLEFIPYEVATMNRSNVGCKSGDSWNRFYGYQVNTCYETLLANGPKSDAETRRTNDQTVHWHCLAHNLEPSPGRSAEIYATSRRFQEGEFLVQLDQLERGTCTVSLFSGRYGQGFVKQMGSLTHFASL